MPTSTLTSNPADFFFLFAFCLSSRWLAFMHWSLHTTISKLTHVDGCLHKAGHFEKRNQIKMVTKMRTTNKIVMRCVQRVHIKQISAEMCQNATVYTLTYIYACTNVSTHRKVRSCNPNNGYLIMTRSTHVQHGSVLCIRNTC